MLVVKFGGSSVSTPENLKKVLQVVKNARSSHSKVAVVLSALGGVTDNLLLAARQAMQQSNEYIQTLEEVTARHIEMIQEVLPIQHQSSLLTRVKELCNEVEDICKGIFLVRELTPHTSDSVCSYGEVMSTMIFSEVLKNAGIENIWCDSRDYIKTNGAFGNATVNLSRSTDLLSRLNETGERCFVFPGFIGRDENDKVTTLGRGGSDYTASVIAYALKASELQVWTDVSGLMTADPGLVKNPRIIRDISYEEALELSHFGAKVIYPKTIAPAMAAEIPIVIKNSFEPEAAGTVIQKIAKQNGDPIKGISSMKNVAILTLEGSGMIGIPGFSKRLFEVLANESINVILITQSSSEYSICVAVDQEAVDHAKRAVDSAFAMEIELGKVKPGIVEKNMAIVALVGDKMKSRAGMSGKMFSAMGRNNINVRAIAQGSSERNISAVISANDVKKALNVLHEEFFENTYKQINLYICGTGNVGKRLLSQLESQHEYLKEKLKVQIRIVGLANSRKMVISENGIEGDWKAALDNGEPSNIAEFVNRIITENKRNSIFVDVTANEEVTRHYKAMLSKSVSVVACNKIACSSTFEAYSDLKDQAAKHNASFLFETNVGAGLPIIGTLNDLLRSGDEITKIEAVLSGTLNFVFNNYNAEAPFAEVVRMAAREGYTEPDPRLDLSGIDVMRKILILARESGAVLELDDIENVPFMPEECMKGSIENFYEQMEKHEDHFRRLYTSAAEQNKKLKYVARFENNRAYTGLQQVSPENDFYHLYGKDNVVLFYTHRYAEQPLVVKGAGAGADVTASGVFADILRAVR